MCKRRVRKYEMIACVRIIQHEGCMSASEYRKYELWACVCIIQHEGASMSASTSGRHASASYIVRAA
jgi:hypothetical protein